jgi:hypothetical protein
LKHAIITATDRKYGSFLVNHWYRSLKENVNLSNSEVVVLDYGLSPDQRKMLKEATVVPCDKDGHVTSLRFGDMARFLAKNKYDQIFSTDGGDIIFQADIANLFEVDKHTFRVYVEKYFSGLENVALLNVFNKEYKLKPIRKKRLINAGVILGPHDLFMKMCEEVDKMIKNKRIYGPDQIAVNYILNSLGFIDMGENFNYCLSIHTKDFKLVDGTFYDREGRVIPLVHNSGGTSPLRTISNFGYGPGYNKRKRIRGHLLGSIRKGIDKLG